MPQRTNTKHLTSFHRSGPEEVTYDLSQPHIVTITLPPHSKWTSGLHWHETHTEYLQVVHGRALVTLHGRRRLFRPEDGQIEVPKGMVHEWRRVLDSDDPEDQMDLIVKEWTVPADGEKEVFFRILNSFLIEKQPHKLYDELPWPLAWLNGWLERYVIIMQLFMIFKSCDNWPVLVGTGSNWLSWSVTHIILFYISIFGRLLGLQSRYGEYVFDSARSKKILEKTN